MRAMVLEQCRTPLVEKTLPVPHPQPNEVLLRVLACGVCRTDLHILDGELVPSHFPVILGHQIVGEVAELGSSVQGYAIGDRVGVPWLGWTCGQCRFCVSGRENLCDSAQFTGFHRPGGFAEFTVADARFCFRIDPTYPALHAAPLLCAGLIGYRALSMTDGAERIGLYGFGAAAHLVLQVAKFQERVVYAFTKPGDRAGAHFARTLGADWVGGSDENPPDELDAAIIFAPVGALVPLALKSVRPGGVVVCAGIHMSDIPSFPYRLLWQERVLRSVANLTRKDGEEFLALAPKLPIETTVHAFPLAQANEALSVLREGRLEGGAIVLAIADQNTKAVSL